MRFKGRLRRGKGRVRQPCPSPCLLLGLAYINEGMGKRSLRDCAPVGVYQRISVRRHTPMGCGPGALSCPVGWRWAYIGYPFQSGC